MASIEEFHALTVTVTNRNYDDKQTNVHSSQEHLRNSIKFAKSDTLPMRIVRPCSANSSIL